MDISESVLPEFYLLSFLEKKYNREEYKDSAKTILGIQRNNKSSPSLRFNGNEDEAHTSKSMGNASLSTSIALSSRAAKQKHDTIVRLRKVESKIPKLTLIDKVMKDLHIAHRKLYSRGHCVPAPKGELAKHPQGAAPVVLRNHETASRGRFSTSSRPTTASERYSPIKTSRKDDDSPLYIRPTQRQVLNSRGTAIAEDCARSSWHFKKPLDAITMPRPSTFASSLQNAPLPDCAECLLEEGPYATLAGAARLRILEKTTQQDRLYLVTSRGGAKPYPASHPAQGPPYSIDYSQPGSPDRRKRPCWKKSPFLR